MGGWVGGRPVRFPAFGTNLPCMLQNIQFIIPHPVFIFTFVISDYSSLFVDKYFSDSHDNRNVSNCNLFQKLFALYRVYFPIDTTEVSNRRMTLKQTPIF